MKFNVTSAGGEDLVLTPLPGQNVVVKPAAFTADRDYYVSIIKAKDQEIDRFHERLKKATDDLADRKSNSLYLESVAQSRLTTILELKNANKTLESKAHSLKAGVDFRDQLIRELDQKIADLKQVNTEPAAAYSTPITPKEEYYRHGSEVYSVTSDGMTLRYKATFGDDGSAVDFIKDKRAQ